MNELTVNIAKEFSKYLGGGKKGIVPYTGEEFREQFLDENFDKYNKINIELDGVLGYPWDFLDQSFGELARKHGASQVNKKLKFISQNNYVIDKIKHMIGT